MRKKWLILCITLGLLSCSRLDSASAVEWRRTAQGWVPVQELANHMHTPAAAHIHPGLIASFEVMLSLGGLLLFSGDNAPSAKTA